MKARKVIFIRPSLFVRTIISAARIDLLDDTNKIPYSGGKNPTGSLFEGSQFFTMTQYSLHGCHKGTYDEEGIMNRFAKAYGYVKPVEGDANETAQD